MKKIAITGLSGAIGKKLISKLPKDTKIYDLFHNNPSEISENLINVYLNLADFKSIKKILNNIKPDTIIHMAAITHIDRCERDRHNGRDGEVWKINVEATDQIAAFSKKNRNFLMMLSTECVFDGNKGFYSERSKKSPKNWYGITKGEAEERVFVGGCNAAILRSVIAYDNDKNSQTLFGYLLKDLLEKKVVNAVSDQMITPTHVDDIVNSILRICDLSASGVFHMAPKDEVTPYELAKKIAKKLGVDIDLVKHNTLKQYFGSDRAKLRLKHSSLNSKWSQEKLGINPISVEDAIERINL